MKNLKMPLVKRRKVWDEFFVLFKIIIYTFVIHQRLFDNSKAETGGRMNT